jgi:hypothetical protein
MQMQVIDKDADTWYIHTGAFRLPSPEGHIFESGVKYQMHLTKWMEGQPTIKKTTINDEPEIQVKAPSRLPKVEREK